MSDNLYFDPSEFDFSSLTDIIGLNDSSDANQYGAKLDRAPSTREEPRDEYAEAFQDDFNDETQTDFNNDVSDILRGEDQSNKVSANNYFNALDDDAVLEFNGTELTKAQVKELYEAKQRVDMERDVVNQAYKSFDEGNKFIIEQLTRNQIVIDNNAAILEKRLNNPNLSAYEKGQAIEELQRVRQEQQRINHLTNEAMQVRHEQEQQAIRHRILVTDAEMSQTHPQWQKYKAVLLSNLAERGYNPIELEKVWCPAIAQDMLDAHLYRRNKKLIAEEAKKNADAIKHPRSTTSVNQSRDIGNKVDKAQKDKALNKMGQSRTANVDAFRYLKD